MLLMGIPNLLVLHRALLDGICQSGPNQNLSVESGVSAAAAASVWACLDLLCKICLDAINKDLVYSYTVQRCSFGSANQWCLQSFLGFWMFLAFAETWEHVGAWGWEKSLKIGGSQRGKSGSRVCKKYNLSTIIEGSLEVKLPTIWTDEKQRWKGSERREE